MSKMYRKISILLTILFTGLASSLFAQKSSESKIPFYNTYPQWADSVLQTMTLDEKIGQLFMAPAYSNKNQQHEEDVLKLIKDYHIGSLIFMQGGPVRQVNLVNKYQQATKIPLMTATDAEWGIGMRLDSVLNYPYQMTLGAIRDNQLIKKMGKEIGYDLRRTGIHVNFAPVVDVNNNPNNPVINYRSFGENKENVSQKGIAYMEGMQEQKVIATAKHFPGHGDTDVDSHYDLPVIKHDRERLENIELYPFQKTINQGIGGVMIAHLSIPALDSAENTPSTLSYPIITSLLKEKMDFEGLIFSDAMNMKAVAGRYEPGVADLKAILAGHDIVEFSNNIPKAISEIKKAVENEEITVEEINQRVRKILLAKSWLGLPGFKPIETEGLVADLNRPSAKLLIRQLSEASLTLLENKNEIIPVMALDTTKIAALSIGNTKSNAFQQQLKLYTDVDGYQIAYNASEQAVQKILQSLEKYDLVITGLHGVYRRPLNQLRYSAPVLAMIDQIAKEQRSIFVLFRNPYLLRQLKSLKEADGLIVAYQDDAVVEEAAAQAIFGGIPLLGQLPVSVEGLYQYGEGKMLTESIRFKYTLPEEVGMNSDYIRHHVDSIIFESIQKKAFPGCQILVSKDRKVIFHESYGFHTYDSLRQVEMTDLYDYASVTKITSALPALMKLYDEDRFSLEAGIGAYLPYFKRGNKKDLTFREILAHQAGLIPYINYWTNTVRKSGKFKWFTFKEDSSKRFPIRVDDDLYLHRKYINKIFKAIKKSPVDEDPTYVYSGLSFILYPEIIKCIIKDDYQSYLKNQFYKPLGAKTITYNPYLHFPAQRIAPTEYDSVFRKKLVRGTVHDEAAAMLGGISSNAGLFSNANDLAKLMQMYLQFGEYGGQRYIDSATIKLFSKCHFCDIGNRRGLGFDKKPLERVEEIGYMSPDVSEASFGHSGFTGTFTWVDPKHDLLIVFLSNRVYPTRDQHMIYELNVRPRVHQVFYDAMKLKSVSNLN